MRLLKITAAALLVLAVAAIAGVGVPETAGGASGDPAEGITVTGEGKASATPDRTSMSFSVQSEGTTAEQALAANNAVVKRLIAALKAAGVAEKDLKTEHFDVSPRWDVDKVREERGYQSSASVTVTNQSLDRASRLGEIATRAGADTVSGPSLTVADPKAAYQAALKRAFAHAREKAEVLASAAGVSLGEVTAIVEGSNSQVMPMYEAAARDSAAKMPIEPGSQEIAATVTVTFALGG
jgi:uncharacterized protein YggE